jgi:hypothetical protein
MLRHLFDRAVAWVKTGDYQKAMLDCDESIVANPSLEAYSLRGDLWLRTGESGPCDRRL